MVQKRYLVMAVLTVLTGLLTARLAHHGTSDLGKPKPESAAYPDKSSNNDAWRLRRTNPGGAAATGSGQPTGASPSVRHAAHSAEPGSPAPAAKPLTVSLDGREYPVRAYELLLTPNDPAATQTWTTNARLPQAWDIPAGNHQTLLAIIDSGFALQHQEFTGRWHTNSGESGPATTEADSLLNCSGRSLPVQANCNLIDDDLNGILDDETGGAAAQNPSQLNCTAQAKPLAKDCNLIDDDANGYIDDITGWDFASHDPSVLAGQINPSGIGTTHGTRVAGIAAAKGNNGLGMAGVDWNTKILPLQALNDNGYGNTISVGKAILYAAEQGADVINLSLGSDLPDDYVREAIRIATAKGSTVVAAAGNDGCECMVYPANYPEVVAVGASDGNGLPAGFSSHGPNLDILAPGTGMYSTSWSVANQTAAYASNISGTSYAAPLVSGLLSRLLSQQPSATPLQLIASLTENTNRSSLPPLATANRTNQYGYGIADAHKASIRMTTPDTSAISHRFTPASTGRSLDPANASEAAGLFFAQICSNPVTASTTLYELQRNGVVSYTLSPNEVLRAQQTGYSTRRFADVCLTQPHDTPASIRNIDVPSEFKNLQQPKA